MARQPVNIDRGFVVLEVFAVEAIPKLAQIVEHGTRRGFPRHQRSAGAEHAVDLAHRYRGVGEDGGGSW